MIDYPCYKYYHRVVESTNIANSCRRPFNDVALYQVFSSQFAWRQSTEKMSGKEVSQVFKRVKIYVPKCSEKKCKSSFPIVTPIDKWSENPDCN